jgi:NADH:ubiquinone reductase (H+-translocating)
LGYGGLRLALDLERGIRKRSLDWELILVDQHPFHQLMTELHQVAAGSVAYDYSTIAYSKLLEKHAVTFRQAKVEKFDFPARTVHTDHGPISYDRLIIGLGGEVDFFESLHFRIPGLRDHSLVVQPIQKAHRTYTQLQERLYGFLKRRTPSEVFGIVIGGGGSTGVELAGQMADEVKEILEKRHLPKETVSLHVVEAEPRLISGFHPKFSEYVSKVLKKKGVLIHLSEPIVNVSEKEVSLASGRILQSDILIWCGGVRGHSLLQPSGLKTDAKGRVLVNGYLQCQGATDVYALGDCTFFLHPETGVPSPPMARLAIEQGHWLSRYLLGQERFPFLPAFRGAVISLGKDKAVAVVGNLRFYGRLAGLLKKLVSLKYLFSLGRFGLVLHQLRVGVLGKI